MASSYPGGLDSFDTIATDTKTSDAVGGRTHRGMHNDLGDAIEAVQAELGTNPAGPETTVAARLAAIEDAIPVYVPTGLDPTGATGCSTALAEFVNAASRDTLLQRGTYLLDARLDLGAGGDAVVLRAEAGTELAKDHSGNGLVIAPTGVSIGDLDVASPGDTTLTVTGATWTVDEHAGKWVEPLSPDPASLPAWDAETTYAEDDVVAYSGRAYVSVTGDNLGNTPTVTSTVWTDLAMQYRRVVSNTADTLTLEYPIGTNIVAGSPAKVYTPLPLVQLEGFDLSGSGSAHIVIRYAERVIVSGVSSTGSSGNALSIYNCDRFEIRDSYFASSSIDLFCYNSDLGRISGVTAEGGAYHGIQLKDCRNTTVSDCTAISQVKNAIDIKCSGRNPSHNNIVANCTAESAGIGFEAYSIQNEGTQFVGENFLLTGVQARGCTTGARINAPGGLAMTAKLADFSLTDSTGAALAVLANDAVVTDGLIDGTGAYAVGVSAADRARIEQVTIRNANLTSGTEQMRVTDTTGARFHRVRFDANTAGATRRAVNETGTSTGNRYTDCEILDATGQLTLDYGLLGTSKAVRDPDLQPATAGMSSVGVDSRPRVVISSGDVAYTSTTTLANHSELLAAVAKGGRYRYRLVTIADGDSAGDLQVAFTGPSGATLGYGTTTAPQLSATTSGNQSSRHGYVASGGTGLTVGMIGAGSKVLVVAEGEITVGTTAGDLQVQYAQVASSGTATTVSAGSRLEIWKVS